VGKTQSGQEMLHFMLLQAKNKHTNKKNPMEPLLFNYLFPVLSTSMENAIISTRATGLRLKHQGNREVSSVFSPHLFASDAHFCHHPLQIFLALTCSFRKSQHRSWVVTALSLRLLARRT